MSVILTNKTLNVKNSEGNFEDVAVATSISEAKQAETLAKQYAEEANTSAEIAQQSKESTEENVDKINSFMDNYLSIAEQHNGIFRGKDLTKVYTVDEIYNRVSSGKFDDLYLGDYFTVSITTTLPDETVKTENVSLMFGAFNYYYNCGDTALTKPHAVLIPRNYGFATTAKMNETNTTEGGYINSYMHTTVLPCYATSLQKALSNHVLTYRDILTNKVNTTSASMAGAGSTGSASGWEWTDVTLQLMNEVQVYGTTAFSSSAFDVGMANRRLPVFKFITPVHYGRNNFWLRSVVSSSNFALCGSVGYTNYSGASNELCARPLILFG